MRRAVLLALLGWVGSVAAEEPPYLADAVQDGSGVLWAYSRGSTSTLYRFDGQQWTDNSLPSDLPANASARGIVRMTDGAVACIWQLPNRRMAVTRHAGRVSLLGIVDGEVPATNGTLPATPLADSQNRLWITGNSSRIYRVDAAGVSVAREILPVELDSPANAKAGYNVVHAAEDGSGRIWVWSDSFISNYASLRCVLIFTGEGSELRDLTSTLKKGARVFSIARADDRHMWVSVANDGLYRVDIDTFTLEREQAPVPNALCRVHELRVDGGDLYAVDDGPAFHRALWRFARWPVDAVARQSR